MKRHNRFKIYLIISLIGVISFMTLAYFANESKIQKIALGNKVSLELGLEESQVRKGRELPKNYSYNYREDLEKIMLELLNDHRRKNKKAILKERKDLRRSARYKSLSMLQLNYFAHENPNFSDQSMSHLIHNVFSYKHYRGVGENLACVSSSNLSDKAIREAFNNLKDSPGHNENMLRDNFDYVGIGVVLSKKPGSKYHNLPSLIVTQHFGSE